MPEQQGFFFQLTRVSVAENEDVEVESELANVGTRPGTSLKFRATVAAQWFSLLLIKKRSWVQMPPNADLFSHFMTNNNARAVVVAYWSTSTPSTMTIRV